ncbi:MAG: hypothetical protein V1818_01565 [Candidatus Aenigmatarchaeota archaeon]
MKKSTKKKIISIFIISAFLFSSFAYALSFAFPTQKQSDVWAFGLNIYIDNNLQQIPAGVGIVNNATDILFTTDYDSIIYKNTDDDVRLKDFFGIWGETFNSTCIFDYCNNGNHSMKMYVCSNCLISYTSFVENKDYELYKINNMDVVRIDYR